MRITNTHVYFFGKESIFSNFYPAVFHMGDYLFFNTEQAFMWQKAHFFNDKESELLIQKESNPSEVKKLGRLIKNFDAQIWSSVSLERMICVNFPKYSQNESLKQELLETEDRILVEASPYDKIWGVGLAETDDKILDEKNWLGQNLLGIALMNVREQLKNK